MCVRHVIFVPPMMFASACRTTAGDHVVIALLFLSI